MSQRSVSHNVVEVFGSRGSLRLSCYHADSLEVAIVGRRTNGAWRRMASLFDRATKLPAVIRAAREGGDFRMSYAHQWERIVESLGSGDSMPASVHDGRQAAAIVLAALRSAEHGASVSLAGPPDTGHADARAG